MLLLVSSFFLSGCVYVVVGSLGALGGYVISPDTVEGVIDNKTYDDAWEAVIETVSDMGLIDEANNSAGIVVAKVRGARVNITVFRLSKSAVKFTIKARKAFLPRISIAQDIYVNIVNYLEDYLEDNLEK
jgi:hypothetical protein